MSEFDLCLLIEQLVVLSQINKKYNCSGTPAFKSQRVEYQSDQKLLRHYQHLNNHLSSYIHSQDTEHFRVSWTKRLLSSHFWPRPPKNVESLNQKSNRLATSIFDYAHPIHFWPAFNFCKSVLQCKKSVHSISSFFKYSQFSRIWPLFADRATGGAFTN